MELIIARTDDGRWQAQVRKIHLNLFGCKVESTMNVGEPTIFVGNAAAGLRVWADLYIHE